MDVLSENEILGSSFLYQTERMLMFGSHLILDRFSLTERKVFFICLGVMCAVEHCTWQIEVNSVNTILLLVVLNCFAEIVRKF